MISITVTIWLDKLQLTYLIGHETGRHSWRLTDERGQSVFLTGTREELRTFGSILQHIAAEGGSHGQGVEEALFSEEAEPAGYDAAERASGAEADHEPDRTAGEAGGSGDDTRTRTPPEPVDDDRPAT